MAGEGELSLRREDAQAIVSPLIGRRADEGRLGQIRPAGDRLHVGGRHPIAVEHDRDGVDFEPYGGEHVDLLEGERRHSRLLSLIRYVSRSQSTKPPPTITVTDHGISDHNSCLPRARSRATMTAPWRRDHREAGGERARRRRIGTRRPRGSSPIWWTTAR